MDLSQAKSSIELAITRSSQNKVAKAIGVDPAAISRWLRGMTEPTGETKTKILLWAEREQHEAWRKAIRETDIHVDVPYVYPKPEDAGRPLHPDRVREGGSQAFAAYYAGVATGMARAVHRALLSALKEQEQLIEHLGQLPAEFDRYPQEGSDSTATESKPAPPKPWLTNEEMDEDHAVYEELEAKVRAAKAAKKSKRKNAS